MDIFSQISLRIIKEQELIVGPIAWTEARKVSGLNIIDQSSGSISLDGNEREVVDKLVSQYAGLFGKASVEACKEAVQDLIPELPPNQVPSLLK